MMKKFKLKKGDNVIIISGKDKGKSGEIIEVLKSIDKVKVRGVNIVKKHRKPTQEAPGKIDEIELPIHISNVSFLDPKNSKPTRIKYEINKKDKVRLTVSSSSKV
ncbi:50S ribosomal protein L24 [Alphaproteobacteria bacterium]|nr:50S ribosomal protein L24 [Alphaproteobacteria bacterium]